jgi:serine/threonine protein phosphatase PrpC
MQPEPETLTETEEFPASSPRGDGPGPVATGGSVRVDLAGLSHPGKVRPNNEDHYLVVRFGRFLQTMLTSLPADDLATEYGETGYGMAVADGMGGMAAGEVASRLAINLLVNFVLETPDWILSGDDAHADEIMARAERRFYRVNESLIERARREPGLKGMGTTLTMACSLGTVLLIAHVGDSPVYLLRRDKLHRLTRDHTLAQQMADHDAIPLRDVPSRYRHVLTHAIGIRESGSEPDVRRFQLEDGDRLLLCTDGLTDMLDDPTIASLLQSRATSEGACQALVDAALARGGRDNVTVVVAGYQVASGT